MKASPFSLLTVVSLLIGFSFTTLAQAGAYTVQLDSMTAQDAAESKVQQLKAQGQNAYWLKSNVPGQGTRYRVRIGRFPNRGAAQNFGVRLKQQGIASDFFVALFEGSSSPLGVSAPLKKVEPAPIITNTTRVVPVENKAVENKPAALVPPVAQRQREVKPTLAPTNGAVEKPVVNSPAGGNVAKPVVPQSGAPITAPPINNPANNNATPKPVPVAPTETKPLQSKPPLPLEELKAPREKKASADPLPAASTTTVATAAAAKVEPPPTPKAATEAVKPMPMPSTPAVAANFQRFEERSFGYSFEHPGYWNGGRLNPEELQAQRIDGGAVFRSQEDVAFMSAIWNSLKNANSPAYDNNLIVDLVVKSLSSSTGLQGLNEVSRRMVQEGDQIKTFVDLRTLFRQPRSNQSLEFQGKAVIIRANTGILLVVTFYAKDSAPTMIAAADRIIGSARVP
jgi:hypothetical protein